MKLDTTRTEAAKDLATADGINGRKSSLMEVDVDDIEDDDTNGVEVVGSLKRKLSSEPDERNRRLHPRLENNLAGPKRAAMTVDENTVTRWVSSLEMLIKGKVKMGHQVSPTTIYTTKRKSLK